MKMFFKRNIDNKGRLVRAVISFALFLSAAFIFKTSIIAAVTLIAAGIFVLFEALRGWCALRACGIKTKL